MEIIFYFFVKRAVDDTKREEPICTNVFLGDIGDFCEIDGVGYIITDYTEEVHWLSDLLTDDNWR